MIVFNGVTLREGTAGVVRYSHAALAALLHGPHAAALEVWLPSALPDLAARAAGWGGGARVRVYPAPHPRRGFPFNQIFWANCLAAHRLRRFPRARVFSPVETFSALPLGRPLLTAHDCYADQFGDPRRGGRTGLGRRLCVRQLRRSRVLAVSRFTADELAARHGLRAPRVLTVPNWLPRGFDPRPDPARAERLRATLGLPGRFWLYAGGYRRNKNLPLLLRAYAQASRGRALPPLVLAGRWPVEDTPFTGPLNTVLAELDPAALAGLRRIGHVADEDLATLYGLAGLALCPSAYEGFGYPVIEAAAAGAPVLAARAASLPEVWPHPDLLFSPDAPEELAGLLARAASEGDGFAHRVMSPEFGYEAGEARLNAAVTIWLEDKS